jgi:LysR family transcriptional activator of nhaA
LNFKHLRYFLVVAKSGGIMRASEQLHITPQTLSGQIKLLEDELGHKLFSKRGRQLELTAEGRVALRYAEEIFTLGDELEGSVRQVQANLSALEFRVGVADSVPKSVAYHLLEPALQVPQAVRMICHEGKYEDLLAQLALHRLDLVISDERMSRKISVKAFNHTLGSSPMSFLCAPSLKAGLSQLPFPACLNDAPMLIQGGTSAIRQQFEQWIVTHQLRPRIVAEFDDSALMNAFGRKGQGVFLSPTVLEDEIRAQFDVEVLARTDELVEEFFAISVERRISHPCVAAITRTAKARLLKATSLT